MLDQQEHSIINWVKKISSDPLFSGLCGFDDNILSASSRYDFLVCLWLSGHKSHVELKLKVKNFSSKLRKSSKLEKSSLLSVLVLLRSLLIKLSKVNLETSVLKVFFKSLLPAALLISLLTWVSLVMSIAYPLPLMAPPFILVPAIMELRFVTVNIKICTTVIVPDDI